MHSLALLGDCIREFANAKRQFQSSENKKTFPGLVYWRLYIILANYSLFFKNKIFKNPFHLCIFKKKIKMPASKTKY